MSDKPTHLLIGVGEVGSAIQRILKSKTTLYWHDINPKITDHLPDSLEKVDVLHITIPQEKNFISEVNRLVSRYSPDLIVIHSTTIPGTVKKLGDKAVHSPILGQHNNLYKHVKTFRKAIGPNSPKSARLAKKFLGSIFNLEFYSNSQSTEAGKILSLSIFAINIEMARYANNLCQELKIDYRSFAKFIKLYNDGYKKNNLQKFMQPLLTPPEGKIGGTCVLPGTIKAQSVLKSNILDAVLKNNQKN